MPSLGADMEKGTLVAWNVKPGDRVKRGDIIAVVETDKGAFDTECYERRAGSNARASAHESQPPRPPQNAHARR
jgi:pyruvate dehydrogenase E2 component (dihydrolipoamide acetyltransferase)